eukprot:scaffold840_cov344-Pavlova_lutheri.AAC.97
MEPQYLSHTRGVGGCERELQCQSSPQRRAGEHVGLGNDLCWRRDCVLIRGAPGREVSRSHDPRVLFGLQVRLGSSQGLFFFSLHGFPLHPQHSPPVFEPPFDGDGPDVSVYVLLQPRFVELFGEGGAFGHGGRHPVCGIEAFREHLELRLGESEPRFLSAQLVPLGVPFASRPTFWRVPSASVLVFWFPSTWFSRFGGRGLRPPRFAGPRARCLPPSGRRGGAPVTVGACFVRFGSREDVGVARSTSRVSLSAGPTILVPSPFHRLGHGT